MDGLDKPTNVSCDLTLMHQQCLQLNSLQSFAELNEKCSKSAPSIQPDRKWATWELRDWPLVT